MSGSEESFPSGGDLSDDDDDYGEGAGSESDDGDYHHAGQKRVRRALKKYMKKSNDGDEDEEYGAGRKRAKKEA